MPRPPTFWAMHPENVPARIRRVADYYVEVAKEARGTAQAKAWDSIASIMEDAATRAEAAVAPHIFGHDSP